VVCVVVGGLQACRREAVPTPESRVLAEVASVASTHALHNGDRVPAQPLMIDVESFSARGSAGFGTRISERQMEASLPMPHRVARQSVAVRCRRLPFSCRVLHDGVFMRMDSVTRTPGGISAFVTYIWTHEGSERSLLGMAQVRIDAGRAGSGWRLSPPALVWIT
jgi:hypothetical protein